MLRENIFHVFENFIELKGDQMTNVKSYLLFTTPFCKFCPTVKEFLSKEVAMPGSHIDATKSDGNQKAIDFKVYKVPTVIFLDNIGNEVTRAHNVSEIRDILSDY